MKIKEFQSIISSWRIQIKIVYLLGSPRPKGCHNGNVAPDLKNKYKTADELVKAAKKSGDPLMKNFKNDENLLREAAKELSLK